LPFSSQPCIQGAIPTLEFVSFAGVMVNESGESFLEIDPELDCQRAVMRVWLETFGHWNGSCVDVGRGEPVIRHCATSQACNVFKLRPNALVPKTAIRARNSVREINEMAVGLSPHLWRPK